MKKNIYFIIASALFFMVGCGEPEKKEEVKKVGFHTNRSSFITTINKDVPTKKERNEYMDEFIINSDIQCQQYLNKSLTQSSGSNDNNDLYLNIIDTASQAFGVKYVTDGAKMLFDKKDDKKSSEAKIAYEKALSPEIKRGVEIAREEYYQKNMSFKKYKFIESYTVAMLEKDMENYDKLCSHRAGLIEINKALKKRKKRTTMRPFSSKIVIDPAVIKHKVETVSKEVDEKNQIKNEMKISDEVKAEAEDGNISSMFKSIK